MKTPHDFLIVEYDMEMDTTEQFTKTEVEKLLSRYALEALDAVKLHVVHEIDSRNDYYTHCIDLVGASAFANTSEVKRQILK